MQKYLVIGLPSSQLASYLESRVNSFLRANEPSAGEVTIRVVSSSDKSVETKQMMKDK